MKSDPAEGDFTVRQYVGDEVTFGRIWRCETEYGERIQKRDSVPLGLTDFAQSWLRKIQPPPLKQTTKESELTHG